MAIFSHLNLIHRVKSRIHQGWWPLILKVTLLLHIYHPKIDLFGTRGLTHIEKDVLNTFLSSLYILF